MKESDITWVNVTADLRETLFVQRQVDAISGSMNTIIMNMAAAKVPQEKIRFFPYADYGLPLYGHCLFATEEFVEKNPKVVTAVVRGVVRGMRAMLSDRKMAVEAAMKRDPLLDPAIEDQTHRGERRDQLGYAERREERLRLRRQGSGSRKPSTTCRRSMI